MEKVIMYVKIDKDLKTRFKTLTKANGLFLKYALEQAIIRECERLESLKGEVEK